MATLKRRRENRAKLYKKYKKYTVIATFVTFSLLITGLIIFYTAPPPIPFVYKNEEDQEVIELNPSLQAQIGGIILAISMFSMILLLSMGASIYMLRPIKDKIICKHCGSMYDSNTVLSRCLDCMWPLKE